MRLLTAPAAWALLVAVTAGGQASAIALTARAAAGLAYRNGVAIVTMAKGGLMYEASVGGQKFSYTPIGR